MRFLPVLFLVLAVSGCLSTSDSPAETALSSCAKETFRLFLTPDLGLTLEPESGIVEGNGFVEAFLTNDIEEFTGPASLLGEGYTWVMDGNFTYRIVVETGYAVAPIVNTGDPSVGYHFFNQFGTSQGFTPGYDVWYEDTVTMGDQYIYEGGWEMPPGGYPIEEGDQIRFLLTNLVLPDEGQRSPRINTHDSWLEFTASCQPRTQVKGLNVTVSPVFLPINQGLLTGAIPANPLNQAQFSVPVEDSQKLQFRLTAADDFPKDDVDMTFYAHGEEVWSGGSPYTNEVATLWRANLDALGVTDTITVEINGYSTVNYQGALEITAWK